LRAILFNYLSGGKQLATFTFTVNGKTYSPDVDENKPLLWVLREDLALTGTKYGCGIARCGACTVLMEDGRFPSRIPVRSCLVRAHHAQSRHITTIEGLSNDDSHPVQQAWIDGDVPQCGYCQSGQIMTTVALLETVRKERRVLKGDDIDAALSGNLCRCGTYPRIRNAVKVAAAKMGINVEGAP
jgi:isoquinoline 1-oxidoreductase alpha subunit